MLRRSKLFSKKNRKLKIELRDIIIPFVSAITAILFNQLFYKQNMRTNAQIEFQKESIQSQKPILNRILAFTYKYESVEVVRGYRKVTYLFDSETNQVFDSIIEPYDTLNWKKFKLPGFIYFEESKELFFSDLNYVRNNRDYLEHSIYMVIDEIEEFLKQNPIPKSIDWDNESFFSSWTNEETHDKWKSLMVELRTETLKVINLDF